MSNSAETPAKKESRPCNLANTLKALNTDKFPPDFVWFDDFHQKLFTCDSGVNREWTDLDTLNLTNQLQGGYGFRLPRVSENTVLSAVRVYAHARTRNEVLEFMEALKWDGSPRIEEFLSRAMGAELNLYTASASRNFLISMAAARTISWKCSERPQRDPQRAPNGCLGSFCSAGRLLRG